MFIPLLFGDDSTLDGAEYESSLFGKTQFDVAVKALTAHFRSLAGGDAQALAAISKKILADYVHVSMEVKAAYNQADLETWLKRIISRGYTRAQALLFLAALRKLHGTGEVGDAVWHPSAWAKAHPEDRSFLDGISDKAKTSFYYALAAGAALMFAFSAPQGITAGIAKAVTGRKKK